MMHHHRGRQLDRAAARQLTHGNVGAAALLHGAAVNQHIQGHHHHHGFGHHHHHGIHHHHGYHPLVWNPWLATNWMVRRSIRREMVRRSCVVPISAGVPLHSTVIVMNPQQQLVVLPAGATFVACAQHQVQDLPELVEVIFDQEGKRTTLYADRKCVKCGQFFFCYSSDAPAPYVLPSQPTVVPPPAAVSPYPAQQQPYPPAASPYPAAASPYPPAASPYPPAAFPYPAAASPYPPAASPYPAAQQPYPPTAQQPYPSGPATTAPPPYAVSPPAQSSKICLKCTQGSQPNAVFCGGCGSKFPVYCGSCGQTAVENAKFCGYCGKAV